MIAFSAFLTETQILFEDTHGKIYRGVNLKQIIKWLFSIEQGSDIHTHLLSDISNWHIESKQSVDPWNMFSASSGILEVLMHT